jgi:uncharacterized membrane protein YjgN (DUF898 family)
MRIDVVPEDRLPPRPVEWRGRGSIWGLVLKNLLLTIVTLGIYRFWARTRLRRFVWGNIEVLGDPLAYTGSGLELFKGFLRALVVLVPLGIAGYALNWLFADNPVMGGVATFAIYLVFVGLYFVALFSARRYRLSRTEWRGVRGGQEGSIKDYVLNKIVWTLLSVVTLGLAAPWMRMREQKYLLERTLLGDRRFAFQGNGRDLFGAWLVVYLTLGIGLIWYRVREFRYVAGRTTLGGASFASTMSSRPIYGRILLVMFLYVLIAFVFGAVMTILTFSKTLAPESGGFFAPFAGLAFFLLFASLVYWPWIYIPIIRHFCRTFVIANGEALADIAQSTQARRQSGEGLADAFDVGIV